ncbi:MAG: hypothetical protein AAFX55_12465 [Bacteroidota bacterium]
MELLFQKNKELFEDQLNLGVKISSDIEKKDLEAIVKNKPLSDVDLPIILADGDVTAKTGDDFKFKDVPNVNISAGVEGNLRLAIYDTTKETIDDLKSDDLDIELPELDANECYGVFSYGYTINGNVKGDWPLGSVKLSASSDGGKSKRAAVIVTLKKSLGVKKSLLNIIGQLRSPKQVNSATDLAPGTFLVMDREGHLETNFKAKVGFDFDWLYESQNPNLSGTMGLKTKLGGFFGVGFNLAGHYNLTVSRPNRNRVIHLKLDKRRLNGWNFAAGIDASVQGDLPDDFSVDDLLKATIGVHHLQALQDIRSWLDPNNLDQKLHGITDDLLQKITETNTFNKAKTFLEDLFEKWDAVGEESGSALFNVIEQYTSVDLVEIQNEFKELANTDVTKFLNEKLQKIGFLNTPFGEVLSDIIPFDDLFEIVADQKLVKQLQEKAEKIAELLDLEAFIKKLHKNISEELSLDRIRKAASGDLSELGDWLKEKLERLTDNHIVDELEKINTFITNFRLNGAKVFEKVKEALEREYQLSFAFAYQKEQESTALINAKFNFTENPKLGNILDDVLDGDYSELLTNSEIKGIFLENGVLTHKIKKQKTLSLVIPGAKRNFTRINQSIAKGTFIDESDGRLIMYELNSTDTRRRNNRLIQLALTGSFLGNKKSPAFGIEEESLKLSFNFRVQNKRLKTLDLEEIVEPFIATNLAQPFKDTRQLTTSQWLEQLDDFTEHHLGNGRRVFGKTLINMVLKIPSEIGNAWLDAPTNRKHSIYLDLSEAVQLRMRELARIFVFENNNLLNHRKHNIPRENLLAMLLYMSMPTVRKRRYNFSHIVKKTSDFAAKLNGNIMRLEDKLRLDPDEEMSDLADKFKNRQAIVSEIADGIERNSKFQRYMKIIVANESEIIRDLIEFATEMPSVKKLLKKDPEKGLAELAKYGSKLTKKVSNFNFELIGENSDNSRFIGPELFITASKILKPRLNFKTHGYLELIVLKNNHSFEMETYLDGERPKLEDILISQLIANLG